MVIVRVAWRGCGVASAGAQSFRVLEWGATEGRCFGRHPWMAGCRVDASCGV